jgi:hypothetical protein
VVKESYPFDYKSSSQISETRGFLQVHPKIIDTQFVSFSSYRISEKTTQKINLHSACELTQVMKTNEVIAPFTIKNSVFRMMNPVQDAPEYANSAAEVYKTLITVSPIVRSLIKKADIEAERIFPFCNSFVMSKKTYKRFYGHLTDTVERAWFETGFNAKWCDQFSSDFSQREFGMLFERFTALWIGLDHKLKIFSNGWGETYPMFSADGSMNKNDWKSQNNSIELAKSPALQYN